MIYAQHRNGVWCIAHRKRTLEYKHRVKAQCGCWVYLPRQFSREPPVNQRCARCVSERARIEEKRR